MALMLGVRNAKLCIHIARTPPHVRIFSLQFLPIVLHGRRLMAGQTVALTMHNFVPSQCRGAATASAGSSLKRKREERAAHLETISEVRHRTELLDTLRYRAKNHSTGLENARIRSDGASLRDHLLDKDIRIGLTTAMATFLFHVESRIAFEVGEGFYTIGPCGEEMLGAVGLALKTTDMSALHYRHLATSLARHLVLKKRPNEDIFLDRARGYTVSINDPVSGGHHCCLGGTDHDIVVTSTLASQCPSAVGRASGNQLAHSLKLKNTKLPFPKDAVSYVSLGDGSVNNAHFLASVNLAEYFQHRKFKCPIVFGISDNQLCISLKGYDWLESLISQRLCGTKVLKCDGTDFSDVFRTTKEAIEQARKKKGPVAIIFQNIPRRYGHAATDRQMAYLTKEEILNAMEQDVVLKFIEQCVEANVVTYDQVADEYELLWGQIQTAFDKAAEEPKIQTREQAMKHTSQPMAALPLRISQVQDDVEKKEKPQVMRKNMTRVLQELLAENENLVYMGEDVTHGGYYIATEGLHAKYSHRVADFPPDETTLVGCAAGYSQVGLLPIVELPYAKYLDCGADSHFENIIMNWLTASKRPQGMIVRLQGFDRGLFGGNFHTHNSLYLPPGLDVVCYSNGSDYVRGMRHAILQAKAGRIVMLVDSTALLNQRHVFDGDNAWMFPYPTDKNDMRSFDEITVYGKSKNVAVVTYGNGVPLALQAQKKADITVIDVPYLSGLSSELVKQIGSYEAVVFADVCKFGQHPQARMVAELQSLGKLPIKWRSIGACPTYNPLGRMLTFLSQDDILAAVKDVA